MNFVQFIFFSSGLLGLLISLVILINLKKNKIMNRYFIFFLCIISLGQLFNGVCFLGIKSKTIIYLNDYLHLSVLCLPIIYLYIKQNLNKNSNNGYKEFIGLFIFPSAVYIVLYEAIELFSKKLNTHNEILRYIFSFFFSCYFIHLCFKILSKEIWFKKEDLIITKQEKLFKSWVKFLTLILLIVPINLLSIISFKLFDKPILVIYHNLIITSAIIFIISLKLLLSPQILYGLNRAVDEIKKDTIIINSIWKKVPKLVITNFQDKTLKNKVDPNLLNYKEKIEEIIKGKELFIIPRVSINDIATSLKIPKSHLIYLFKYHTKVSFIELKHIIRVNYAKELIEQDFLNENTLITLSEKVGFSSYNPFFTSFKKITGSKPHEYLNSINRKSNIL